MTTRQGPDTRRRVGADAVVIALGYLTSFVYPLVSLPFLARMLGVSTLGTVMVLLAVLQLVVHVSDFGFSISALRRASITRDVPGRFRVLMETMAAKTLIWIGCAGTMIVVVLAVPALGEHLMALLIGLLLVLAGAWYPGWLLQAMGRMTAFAMTMAASRIGALAGLLLTVRGPQHLELAVAWQLAPQALAAVVTWVLVVGVWGLARPTAVTRTGVLTALRDSAPLFVANAAAVVTGAAGSLALGAFSTAAQVAYFGAAERFGNAVRGVMRGVCDAMLPRMTAGSSADVRRFVITVVPAAYGLAGVCLLGGAGWVIPWYLGAEMAHAVTPTRLVGIAMMLAGITATCTLTANAAHRYGTVARLTGIAAAVHVLLCVPAALWAGASGIAGALICSEAVLALMFVIDAARRRRSATVGTSPSAAPSGTVPPSPAPQEASS